MACRVWGCPEGPREADVISLPLTAVHRRLKPPLPLVSLLAAWSHNIWLSVSASPPANASSSQLHAPVRHDGSMVLDVRDGPQALVL